MNARKATSRVDRTILVFALILAAGVAWCWEFRGEETVRETFARNASLVLDVLPALLGGLVIAGYAQVLIPRDFVTRHLGKSSGFVGLVIASVMGAITPGGPFASFGLVVALHRSGVEIGLLVAYVTAWSVLGLHRIIIWEFPLLGADFALTRIAVSLPLPFIAAVLARAIHERLEPSEGRPTC